MTKAVEDLPDCMGGDVPRLIDARIDESAPLDTMAHVSFCFQASENRAYGRILERSLRCKSRLDIGGSRLSTFPYDIDDVMFEFGESRFHDLFGYSM